jgi:hypothetical protein
MAWSKRRRIRRMKKIGLILAIISFLYGCSTYLLTDENVNPWLISKAGKSSINVTGIWDGGNMMTGGWGEGRFMQDGNRIDGTLGLYHVRGSVNGAEVHLALISKMQIYYTVALTATSGTTLEGKAVYGAFPENVNSVSHPVYLMILKKVVNKL